MTVQQIEIKKLKLTDKNPRKIDKDSFAKLCQNLQDDPSFLQLRPILVYELDEQFWVYAGNQRVRAAKKLGWKSIPCIVSDYNEAEIQRRMVLDNLHSGTWDHDMLSTLYEPLELLALGMTEKELQLNLDLIDPPSDNEEDEHCLECGQKIKQRKKQ